MRVRLEVDLAATAIRDVRIALGRPEVGVAEHLLNGSQVGAAFEEMRRERMAEEMGMHASRLETRSICKLSEDHERPGPCQRATARVQEELRPVSPVEMWAAKSQVPAHRLSRRPPERYQTLLVALPEHADDPFFESDATLLESDRLGHAQAGSVEKLHERTIAERSRARADGRVDEALGLGRRQRARESARPPW